MNLDVEKKIESAEKSIFQKKQVLLTIMAFLLFAFGISIQVKARVGQSMFTALAVTLSDLTHLKVGTVLNLSNLVFLLLLLGIRRSKLVVTDGIMVAATLLYGYVVNFFVYFVLADMNIESYPIRVVVFIIGVLLSAGNLGVILACGILRFPLEAFCVVICEKLKRSLTVIRMWLDVFFLVAALVITFVYKQPLNIREGTILSFFLLSYGMGKSYEWTKAYLLRREAC